MNNVPVITIDGPTASGKGTIAQRVADALQFNYLDSGALYRLVAWRALQDAVSADDADQLSAVAAATPMRAGHAVRHSAYVSSPSDTMTTSVFG